MRSLFMKSIVCSSIVPVALLMGACGGERPDENKEAANGTFSMPLHRSVGGHTYGLSGSVLLYSVDWSYYVSLALPLEAEVVRESLPTGAFTAELYDWSLTRVDDAGNWRPVAAQLVSSPYQSFSILNGTTTTISYTFEADHDFVSVGEGALNIDIDVLEKPSACAPLRDDCGDGAWCAPAELLGSSVRCIPAGATEVGAACASPFGCVANASCFDFGSGPECAELCSSADLGQTCASGGTCTQHGADHGVCLTEPLAP